MFGPHTLSRSPKAQNESHSQSRPTLHGRTVEDASHAPQGVNLPTRRQPLGDRKVAVPKVRRACLRSPFQVQAGGKDTYQAVSLRLSQVLGVGGAGAHLPIIIAVQVATDGQHGAGEVEALGSHCSKGVWRLVNQTGIGEEVEGWGAGARVDWGHLETDR